MTVGLAVLDLYGNGIDSDGIAKLRACWPGDSGLEIGTQFPGDEMYQVPPGGFSDDEDGSLIPMMYQVPPGGITDDEGDEDEEEASDMGDGSSQESGQESEEEESGQESEEED